MNIHQIPMTDVRRKLAELEGQDIKDPTPWDVRKRILDRHANGKTLTGLTLPWVKTHEQVRLRPGEVSIWGGYNGHNKSTILTQVAAWAAKQTKVGIGSFEMELEDTYNLAAQLAAGTNQVAPRWLNDFCTWCQDRLFVYDRLDAVPADQVLSGIDYMAEVLGCGLVIIDSLMMCRGVVDDMEKEREFVTALTGLAKYHKIHIALAHHMKKPQHGDESSVPGKYELRGTGGLSDLAHTIFICWSNKELRELRAKERDGIPLTPEEQAKLTKAGDRPDQLLKVCKQRHGEFEGTIGLWQHASRQFTATPKRTASHIDIPRLEATA